MKLPVNLEQMTLEDKLLAMELIWDDLCHNADEFPSPQWHGDILQARAKALKDGNEQILDWDQVKKDIRARLMHSEISRDKY